MPISCRKFTILDCRMDDTLFLHYRSIYTLAQRKWNGRAKHSGYKSVVWDITYQRSRYSSLAAVLGSKTPRRVPAVLKYLLMISVISLQPRFTLLCFVLFVSESTTLCLSPHPKPRPALTGSGTLSVVNINNLDTCQNRRRYITGYKRKQRKLGMDYVHL